MKLKISLLAIAIGMFCNANAQITLDHVYATDRPTKFVKLSLSGLMYEYEQNSGATPYFKLYNSNHSVFKTINISPWSGKSVNSIEFISETLFDTDSMIEYAVNYTNGLFNSMRICKENGTILLEIDSANVNGSNVGVSEHGFLMGNIFPDGTNSKLLVAKGWGSFATVEVYNLPGQLACLECSNGLISGLIGAPHDVEKTFAFPNPTTDNITINYNLNPTTKVAFIKIFDINGKQLKQMEIDNHFNSIIISVADLNQGAYFYEIIADGKVITRNKIVKVD